LAKYLFCTLHDMKNHMRIILVFSVLMIATASCSSDEPAGTSTFGLETEIIYEGSATSERQVLIKREGSTGSVVKFDYQISHVSTEEGIDLKAASGSVEFQKGVTEVEIPVLVTGDSYHEIIELFKLVLTNANSTYEYEIIILDDDIMMAPLSDNDGFYTPAEYNSMRKVWSDEFDGQTLDAKYWTNDVGNGCPNLCQWGNQELQLYGVQSDVMEVNNGKLTIRAINDNGTYRSARIKTKDKVELTYGRIDIRAKLPRGKGIWPALWALGSNIDTNPWPGCGEIDLMELIGSQPSTVHGTVHYQDFASKAYRTSGGSTQLNGEEFSQKFHVFTTIWDRNRIEWYLDNKLYNTFSYPNETGNTFRLPYYFLMNVAVGGRWPGSPDNTTVFPQEMIVDYIRVFQ